MERPVRITSRQTLPRLLVCLHCFRVGRFRFSLVASNHACCDKSDAKRLYGFEIRQSTERKSCTERLAWKSDRAAAT